MEETNSRTSASPNFSFWADRATWGCLTQIKQDISWILNAELFPFAPESRGARARLVNPRAHKVAKCFSGAQAANSDGLNAFVFLFIHVKSVTESKISSARATWPREFFLPLSAFPPIFQCFKYRSAVEQTSSAQYRLSVCRQTAGQLDAHQPTRRTHKRKAAFQANFTYVVFMCVTCSLRRDRVRLSHCRPLTFCL